ncbi:MAG: VOC family protein [Caulobacteraceae bacterium]
MPNLEHLKKQAKLYLRWHREGHAPVAAQIRRLPRFKRLSDQEVLTAGFTLTDAQELVASKAGWESWLALLKDLRSMPTAASSPATPSPAIVAAEPQLLVNDLAVSLDFYTTKLGFQVAFSYGEPPFYAQVARGGGRLNLRCVRSPTYSEGFREREPDVLAATLTLEDAKPLFLELRQAGVEFHQPLRSQPWGSRTFIVRDPDGNLLCFAGHGGEAARAE